MSNNQKCSFLCHLPDGIQHDKFRIFIQCGGRLIQNKEITIPVNRPSNPKPLSLAAGKPDAAFPNLRIQSIRKTSDKGIQSNRLKTFHNLLLIHVLIFQTEGDIALD